MNNKHECAGYGDDNAHDNKKPVRKESSTASNAPAKVEQPIDPQLTRPPPLSHAVSNASQRSDSTSSHTLKREEDGGSIGNGVLSLSTRNRMPYFRYFGPTAIMPGFKQMVVKVRGKQHGSAQTASDQHAIESSPALPSPSLGSPPLPEARTPLEIPVYDNSPMSPSPLITHLCKLFFVHLGCSFPFLQRERFMRDLEEKQVDAILVDAVCALSARFSTHPMLTGREENQKDEEKNPSRPQPPEYGQAFALRAKSAIPDAFPCPSVAVVQAALLLAYDEFGASRDSGLWMYLGIAIRMAQDLGMQTLEGLKYEGRDGPTPISVKNDAGSQRSDGSPSISRTTSDNAEQQEQRAAERERLDTFWSVFFLDRVISSGTGRPVTLRDRDIEISFPSLDEVDPTSGWPLPFPALIRIIHLYGRVTDLINRIRDTPDIPSDLQKQLASLEDRLTLLYQNLSPRLHFNAVNFQQYVKFNQGTNFLLMHCWFHVLIVLLHQPTLLKPFERSPQGLSTNSRELSMSSAKTIADILSFTELIDARAGMGNPFTSQPIYIAGCAFLNETAIQAASSQPQSRPSTPGSKGEHEAKENREQKQAAKHTLLASAANQNYQRCYRALKSLETYWAGVKYILTVMDQKAKGVTDPILYTREEMESALEVPRPEPSFTSPGWRRKLSWGTYLSAGAERPGVGERSPGDAGSGKSFSYLYTLHSYDISVSMLISQYCSDRLVSNRHHELALDKCSSHVHLLRNHKSPQTENAPLTTTTIIQISTQHRPPLHSTSHPTIPPHALPLPHAPTPTPPLRRRPPPQPALALALPAASPESLQRLCEW